MARADDEAEVRGDVARNGGVAGDGLRLAHGNVHAQPAEEEDRVTQLRDQRLVDVHDVRPHFHQDRLARRVDEVRLEDSLLRGRNLDRQPVVLGSSRGEDVYKRQG